MDDIEFYLLARSYCERQLDGWASLMTIERQGLKLKQDEYEQEIQRILHA